MACLVELQTTLPRIPKTVWPLAGVTIIFVPDKLLSPKPALFAQCQNQFQNKRMTFAVLCLFFDI